MHSGCCIGQQKHRMCLSKQKFLVDSAASGSPQSLAEHSSYCTGLPGQAILYSYSSTPTLLLILTCPHSQPSREAGRNFPFIQKCGLCPFTWRSHSSQEQSRAVGQPCLYQLEAPTPLCVPAGPGFTESCMEASVVASLGLVTSHVLSWFPDCWLTPHLPDT